MSELPDRDAINALFAGNYSDPFTLLGMYQTQQGLEVRALLTEALEGGDNWHHGVQRLVHDLNYTYQYYTSLHQLDFDPQGFEQLVIDDAEYSVFAFLRRDCEGNEVIVVSNFTPVPRPGYRFGVNQLGQWREVLNTDQHEYHGSDVCNHLVHTDQQPSHGRPQSLSLNLPPLATLWLVREGE